MYSWEIREIEEKENYKHLMKAVDAFGHLVLSDRFRKYLQKWEESSPEIADRSDASGVESAIRKRDFSLDGLSEAADLFVLLNILWFTVGRKLSGFEISEWKLYKDRFLIMGLDEIPIGENIPDDPFISISDIVIHELEARGTSPDKLHHDMLVMDLERVSGGLLCFGEEESDG